MKLLKRILNNVVDQIIPIMIGVYLGFAINNFSEDRKLHQQKEKYQQMLTNEIEENLHAVLKVNPYHQELMDSTQVFFKKKEASIFEDLPFHGWQPALGIAQ